MSKVIKVDEAILSQFKETAEVRTGLMNMIGINQRESEELWKNLKKRYPKVKNWEAAQIDHKSKTLTLPAEKPSRHYT